MGGGGELYAHRSLNLSVLCCLYSSARHSIVGIAQTICMDEVYVDQIKLMSIVLLYLRK